MARRPHFRPQLAAPAWACRFDPADWQHIQDTEQARRYFPTDEGIVQLLAFRRRQAWWQAVSAWADEHDVDLTSLEDP